MSGVISGAADAERETHSLPCQAGTNSPFAKNSVPTLPSRQTSPSLRQLRLATFHPHPHPYRTCCLLALFRTPTTLNVEATLLLNITDSG